MYRNIHTEIWTDSWFLQLEPQAKLLFVYLFSNERTNLAGLYNIVPQVISWHTGIPEEDVLRHLKAFGKAGKAHYEDGWIWIPNFLARNCSLRSQKVRTNIDRTLASIPDMPLKHRWMQHYNQVLAPQYGVERLVMTMAQTTVVPSPPANLKEWMEEVQQQKNRHAVLLEMFKTLFPDHDSPSYSYIGSTVRTVGGAGRLAQLLWMAAGRQVTGDPLAYAMGIAKGESHGTRGNGTGRAGSGDSASTGSLTEPSEFYSEEELAGLEPG